MTARRGELVFQCGGGKPQMPFGRRLVNHASIPPNRVEGPVALRLSCLLGHRMQIRPLRGLVLHTRNCLAPY
jgi:hypothetical protein